MAKIPEDPNLRSLYVGLLSVNTNARMLKVLEDVFTKFKIEDSVKVSSEALAALNEELSAGRKYQLDNGAAPNTLSDLLYLSQKRP